MHWFASIPEGNYDDNCEKTQTPLIKAGIKPLEQVTRYRGATNASSIPQPNSPSFQLGNASWTDLPAPPPATTQGGSEGGDSDSDDLEVEPPINPHVAPHPRIRRKATPSGDNQPPNDTEAEVYQLARPLLIPSMSRYERERILNSIRNQILLKQLCPPTLDSGVKAVSSKRPRPPSPNADYRPSEQPTDLPRRKSRRTMVGGEANASPNIVFGEGSHEVEPGFDNSPDSEGMFQEITCIESAILTVRYLEGPDQADAGVSASGEVSPGCEASDSPNVDMESSRMGGEGIEPERMENANTGTTGAVGKPLGDSLVSIERNLTRAQASNLSSRNHPNRVISLVRRR